MLVKVEASFRMAWDRGWWDAAERGKEDLFSLFQMLLYLNTYYSAYYMKKNVNFITGKQEQVQ